MKCSMLLVAAGVAAQLFAAEPRVIGAAVSPNGRNAIRLTLGDRLEYTVAVDGLERISASPISLSVAGRPTLGGGESRFRDCERRQLTGMLDTPIYKKSSVSLAAAETFVRFEGDWGVRLVARDDGVAFRFETAFGAEKVRVTAATTGLTLAPACERVIVSPTRPNFNPKDHFQNSGEAVPVFVTPEELLADKESDGQHLMLPLVAVCSDGRVVAVTESDLLDFPGLQLGRDQGASPRELSGRHQPVADKVRRCGWGSEDGNLTLRTQTYRDYIAETAGTRTYPWRVFAVADNLAKLPENDAVYALASPSRIADSSWIKPGKVAWEWWTSVNLSGVDFKAGFNDRSYEYFIDFAADYGLEYVMLDLGWSENADPMKPVVDVPHLIDYAKKRNVGLIAWAPRVEMEGRVRAVMEHYAKLGIKGFKIDALDGNDQAGENFIAEMAGTAADLHLFLDLHGIHKPTGLMRTYPNILNYEGVYGLENCKWGTYDNAWNNLASTYVRMTAGPLDYTPGGFRNETWKGFHPVFSRPTCRTTRVHQMALFSHFEAPLLVPCDSPSLYRKEHECFSFVAGIPTVWDETVGVAGGCAEGYSAIARRKGEVWYLSVIGNSKGGEQEVPLAFLGAGEWQVESFADGINANRDATDYRHEFSVATAETSLKVKLARSGGYLARLTRSRR